MRKPIDLWMMVLFCCISCSPTDRSRNVIERDTKPDRWAIYYGYQIVPECFKDYDLLVFDRIYYPDFRKLSKKTKILAYINAGEARDGTDEQLLLNHEHMLFSQASQGSWPVDLNSERWKKIVLARVDDAVRKGFDGIMLDRIDSSLQASALVSPEIGKANQEAAVALIEQIRARYPGIKIMLNRGFDILPHVATEIDYILAQNILTEINVSAGQSHLIPSNSYQQTAGSLRWARDLSPAIKIYTLDYWNVNDVNGVRKIYRLQREQGFSPYVTTPDLRHLTLEPR